MFSPELRFKSLVLCFAGVVLSPLAATAQATDANLISPTPSVSASSARDTFDAVDDNVIAAVTAEVAIATAVPTEASRAWEVVQRSGTKEDVFSFIETYPGSPQAKYAKALMIDLLWTEIAAADAAAAAPEPVETPVAAVASTEVELVSSDGLVSVIGEIVSFDANLISIKTSFGTVGIPNDDISCIGAACPADL